MSKQQTAIPEGFEVKKKSTGLSAYQNAKNWDGISQTGRMVVGTLVALTPPNKYKKKDFIVLATEPGQYIDKEGNVIDYKSGATVTINNCGGLQKQMSEVSIGDSVIIDFDGSAVMRKGEWAGNKAYNFTVYSKPGDGTVPTLHQEPEEETAPAPSISAETKAKLAGLAAKKAN